MIIIILFLILFLIILWLVIKGIYNPKLDTIIKDGYYYLIIWYYTYSNNKERTFKILFKLPIK